MMAMGSVAHGKEALLGGASQPELIDFSFNEREFVTERLVSYDWKTGTYIDKESKEKLRFGWFLYRMPNGGCEMELVNLIDVKREKGIDVIQRKVTRHRHACEVSKSSQ